MWSSNSRPINYALPSDMGMVGLRDVFVVAPASSFHHHHHHHHHQHEQMVSSHDANNPASNAATALGVGVGVGVIPLLTAAPCIAGAPPSIGGGGDVGEGSFMLGNNRNGRGSSGGGGGMQLWQNQLSQQHGQYGKKQGVLDHGNSVSLAQQAGIGGGGGGVCAAVSGGGGVGTTCQDCGNQAKKDCSYRRCRTCCKSRGFDCATHVKSTWVPASRRRERQLMAAAAVGGPTAAARSSGSTSGAKKPRLIASQTTTTSHTSTSNTTPPRSYDTGSSRQDASFKGTLPGQVRAPAVFKCVKVTAVEDGEDEYAYQAVVKINGHIFRGLLYDTGAEGREGFPNISELHLGGSCSGGGGGGGGDRNGGSSSSPIIDPSDVYGAPASGGGFLGGSNYGNPIN